MKVKIYRAPEGVGGWMRPRISVCTRLRVAGARWKEEVAGDWWSLPITQDSQGWKSCCVDEIELNTRRNFMTVSGWEWPSKEWRDFAKSQFEVVVCRALWVITVFSKNQSQWVFMFRNNLVNTSFFEFRIAPHAFRNIAWYPSSHSQPIETRFAVSFGE